MTNKHLFLSVVLLGLAGALIARADDTNAAPAASSAGQAVTQDAKKAEKEAKAKAKQAAKEAKRAEKEAKLKAKQAAKEAAKAEREAKKKAEQAAKEQAAKDKAAQEQAAKEQATNVPPAAATVSKPAHKWWSWGKKDSSGGAGAEAPVTNAAPATTTPEVASTNATPLPPVSESLYQKMKAEWREPGLYNVAVSVQYLFPTDTKFWKEVYGAEVEVQKWFNGGWGVAANATAESWNPKPDANPLGSKADLHQPVFQDSALAFGPGVGVLYRQPLGNEWKLTLDAGVRYTFVDSSILMKYNYNGHNNRVHVTSPVTIDDRVTGYVGARLSGKFDESDDWDVFLGIGYQFDITRDSPNWLYDDIGNDLGSFVVKIGADF